MIPLDARQVRLNKLLADFARINGEEAEGDVDEAAAAPKARKSLVVKLPVSSAEVARLERRAAPEPREGLLVKLAISSEKLANHSQDLEEKDEDTQQEQTGGRGKGKGKKKAVVKPVSHLSRAPLPSVLSLTPHVTSMPRLLQSTHPHQHPRSAAVAARNGD